MPLAAGERLGPYEILMPIGKGGMGEVYRARDTRLGRDVAIKISAERFSNRFEREAQSIAALNHPHICQLYDVGPDYLVMEFVDGKPLKGPIPLDQALEFARQILDALDAAHSKGITHRDLKPGNILVTKAGVKLLDFGLAKTARIPGPDDATATTPLTADGVILGTLQYMSPEQVEGEPADARSDIFAFGLVLYEMITGHMVFEGKSKASLIAAILKEQPRPMQELVPLAPKALDRIVQICLEKDPEKRWRSAHDIKQAIDLISYDAPSARAIARPQRNRWIWPAVTVAFAAIAAAAAWAPWRTVLPPVESTRFQIAAPEGEAFREYMVLSPDGRKLAFTTSGPAGGLWVRDLDSVQSRLLTDTQNASGPSWSPDSRYIAFGVGNQLKKVEASGGPPQTLCAVPNPVGVSTWNREGVILFGGRGAGPLRRVSSAGGEATPVTVLDREASHYWPSFLPDGRHFIFNRRTLAARDQGIFVGSLDLKPEQQPRERLLATNYGAVYVSSSSTPGGYLFFLRENTLMAQRFDAAKLKLIGDAIPVAEQVGVTAAASGHFAVSPSGVLAYRASGGEGSQLMWFDRAGKSVGTFGSPGRINDVSLSPDGKRAAVTWGSPTGGPVNLWVIDVARGVPTRFMFDPQGEQRPVWSRDGSRLAFTSVSSSTIYSKDSTGVGSEESLLKLKTTDGAPVDWSADGKLLLYSQLGSSSDNTGLWVLPLESGEAGNAPMPKPYILTQFRIFQGQFSPGPPNAPRWVAYTSNESGQPEVYVQSFPEGAGKFQVSTGGGAQPRWRRDGKELFYMARDNKLMVVDAKTTPRFEAGVPRVLFQTRIVEQSDSEFRYDVSPDGTRFLIDVQEQVTNSAPITVVLNWEAGLKK